MTAGDWLTIIALVAAAVGAVLVGQSKIIGKLVSEKLDRLIAMVDGHEATISEIKVEFAEIKGQLKGQGCLDASCPKRSGGAN